MRLNLAFASFLIILSIGIVINALTLTDGHNWGGDFAQYLINAQNIIHHLPYNQGIMLDNIISYPPGFPLLLSLILKPLGLNFIALKWVNIFCWYLSIIFIWLLGRNRIAPFTLTLYLSVFCFSSFFFMFKHNVLADIPFLCLTLGSLYFFERYLNLRLKANQSSHLYLTASLTLMAFSILCRQAGISLGLSLILYSIFIERAKFLSVLIAIIIACTLIISQLITQTNTPGFFSQFSTHPFITIKHIIINSPLIWQSLTWFFAHGTTTTTLPFYTVLLTIITIISPLIYATIIWCAIKQWRNGHSLLFVFFYCHLGMLLIWTSFNDSPDNFTRFIFLLAALLIFIIPSSLLTKLRLCINAFLILCLCMNAVNIIQLKSYRDDELYHFAPNQELFTWMRAHIKADEHYMIWEPRTTALLTDKLGTTLAWLTFNEPPQWPHIWSTQHIRYVILNKHSDQQLISLITQSHLAKQVWENSVYKIYEIVSLR